MTNDRSYFMRRASQERSAAANAASERAREAHSELAKRYRKLVGASSADALEEPAIS